MESTPSVGSEFPNTGEMQVEMGQMFGGMCMIF